jgi:hypothetical protein
MKGLLYALTFSFVSVSAIQAATITSTVSGGPWNSPSTWVGGVVPGYGVGDNVIINGNVSQNNVPADINDLTINAGGTYGRNNQIAIRGNFVNNGSMTGSGTTNFRGPNTTISGSGSFIAGGDWYIRATGVTIAPGTSIVKSGFFQVSNNASITNNGSLTLSTETVQIRTNSSFTNGPTGLLDVRKNFDIQGGTLNFTAVGNTLRLGTLVTLAQHTAYHNLILYGGGTKTLTGNTVIGGNMTINVSTTLNGGGFGLSVAGNWANTNTNITNLPTLTFNGTGTQNITRTTGTERFSSLDISTSGTVMLACSLRVDGDLFINSGTFDVSASNHVIDFRGNGFYDNATFNARQGNVLFQGTNPQTIDGFSTTTFWNMTINNTAGVTVNFTKQLNNLLTITAGNFGPSMFGSFVLNATANTQYGRIGPVPAGSTLTGNTWSAEGYVNGPATAYWQYFSTPINGNTLQDWDGDTRFYMSGTGGNDGNACCPVFYSVRTYSEPTNTYTNVTSVSTPLVRGRGYMIWTADNLSSLTGPLIFDSRGTPSFGSFTYPVTAGGSGGGYNLVGNPYACPINFNAVVSASGNLFSSFLILQENGTYTTNPNGGVIGPHQGFLCAATSSGNIQFNENQKNTTALPNLIREADPDNYLRITLTNVMNGLGGETVVQFKQDATANFRNTEDLPFIASPYELASNIWTTAEGKELLLNAQSGNEEEILIPLYVKPGIYGRHSIMFQGLSRMNAYNCVLLENAQTGEVYNLAENNVIDFDVQVPGNEMMFRLRFKNNGDCKGQRPAAASETLSSQVNIFNNGNGLRATFGFTELTDVKIEVYNTLGQLVSEPQQQRVGAETISIHAPKSDNIYLVRISTANETITKKIYY